MGKKEYNAEGGLKRRGVWRTWLMTTGNSPAYPGRQEKGGKKAIPGRERFAGGGSGQAKRVPLCRMTAEENQKKEPGLWGEGFP